jgi:hypothetical protein
LLEPSSSSGSLSSRMTQSAAPTVLANCIYSSNRIS